ncbi:hypothetical protein, partial [Brevibacillus sp. HB2.2]|uniref:hypothetical protein n=1 Tax=Brevibacillus sp. HB2.2 TaxID=2738846 RepID=UPI001C2BAB19
MKNKNTSEFEWLLKHSPKMQRKLGGYGVINSLIDGNYQYSDIQVLLILFPKYPFFLNNPLPYKQPRINRQQLPAYRHA